MSFDPHGFYSRLSRGDDLHHAVAGGGACALRAINCIGSGFWDKLSYGGMRSTGQ